MARKSFEDPPVPLRIRLAGLWASLMFLYVYGDYFNLYTDGKLEAMMAGRIGVGEASEGVLVALGIVMAVPCLMVACVLVLPHLLARWLTVFLAPIYGLIVGLTAPGSAVFYQMYCVLEIGLCLFMAWLALAWPYQVRAEEPGA